MEPSSLCGGTRMLRRPPLHIDSDSLSVGDNANAAIDAHLIGERAPKLRRDTCEAVAGRTIGYLINNFSLLHFPN